MEDNKNITTNNLQEADEQTSFDFKTIYTIIILHWKWFVLSILFCLGTAYVYLRYTTPIYKASAKLLIKDDENQRRPYARNMLANAANLGIMSNSTGIDNEMEVLKSSTISEEAVKDMKLYVTYYIKGRVKSRLVYKIQPINVDIDAISLEKLEKPIKLKIKYKDDVYKITGSYFAPIPKEEEYVKQEPVEIDKTYTSLPAQIRTKAGTITLKYNNGNLMKDGTTMYVTIYPPRYVAVSYAKGLEVFQSAKTTTIAVLNLTDESPFRAMDYLETLVNAYNRQANEDKNEIAVRTEDFINGRLEKISAELGNTEGSIESFKKSNKMIELEMSATQTMANANQYDQKLIDINMQIALINNLSLYINDDQNKYQVIPSNIGLTDPSTTSLIKSYNDVALERSSLLRTASEANPSIKPLTSQLDELHSSIKRAMEQAKRTLEIQKNSIAQQYNKYQGQILNSPEQQRVMNEIGRLQEVQTALYTMLLQKREENSISLAATADKGRLIDKPAFVGKVKPKKSIIMLIALVLGIGIPFVVLFLINFFKYQIEGHDDVAKLTKIPIIGDVAVASESAKTKGEIVVHENQNNMMEEIFRAIRTNVQFMLREGEKVIMATSSIAGEGKTFNIANLAISFALLGKKVALVGLDIRKPRLAELFETHDNKHGITPLLTIKNPTVEDVKAQMINSGVNDNLDLLMAGPVPPNPAELVERKQLEMVIDILKQEYDYVLLDTAPVGLVTDTIQIGRVADLTIAVCRADYTPKDNIIMLNDMAIAKKLPNMAIIINGIDMSKKKHGYYYGYGKYARYKSYGGGYKSYGAYGSYGSYSNSNYANKNDHSIKL
jgi:tyrosine-protein kinase Etk/Wzc